jgi:epoxyqueuosine reductase
LDDPDPVLRGAAVWALSQIDTARFEVERRGRFGAEADEGVCAEWNL